MAPTVSRHLELRYDPDTDTASISLVPRGSTGTPARTRRCDVPGERIAVNVNHDDETDTVTGIEILDASTVLPATLLAAPEADHARVRRIIADLQVDDLEAAKEFYTDYLGLSTEEFNLGWVARYTSPHTGANVQLLTRDAAAPEDPVVSVLTRDVEGLYDEARRRGYEIVHPLTTEPWGVRRFFVRAPDGNVVNLVSHRD